MVRKNMSRDMTSFQIKLNFYSVTTISVDRNFNPEVTDWRLSGKASLIKYQESMGLNPVLRSCLDTDHFYFLGRRPHSIYVTSFPVFHAEVTVSIGLKQVNWMRASIPWN